MEWLVPKEFWRNSIMDLNPMKSFFCVKHSLSSNSYVFPMLHPKTFDFPIFIFFQFIGFKMSWHLIPKFFFSILVFLESYVPKTPRNLTTLVEKRPIVDGQKLFNPGLKLQPGLKGGLEPLISVCNI